MSAESPISLGTSGTPARTLTSYTNSGDLIGHTTPLQSDSWKGWARKSHSRGLSSSGDIIGHTVPVQSDDFNHWPNKKKHLRMADSGDLVGHTTDIRSEEFTEVNSRHKPAGLSFRNSGDIVYNRGPTVSDDFMTMDARLKKSPYKHISNVPLGDDVGPEIPVPGFRVPKPSGRRTSNFDTNEPTPEDLRRTYRPTKRMTVTPGAESDQSAPEAARPGRRVFAQHNNSVLSPATRDEASEVQPVAYLGSRKMRVPPPTTQNYSDERRPCRRLYGRNPYDHGNIVHHTEERPHTAPSRFSKRVFEQSRDSESKHSADESQHFSKRVYRDHNSSQGLTHDTSPAPAPVFAHTGYNQARVLKSAMNYSRQERHRNHGDIVGWTNVKL